MKFAVFQLTCVRKQYEDIKPARVPATEFDQIRVERIDVTTV